MKRKKLLIIASVALIATFLAVPLVSAYTNYDIMTAIKNVQSKLNSTYSKLASVQTVVNNIFTIVSDIATKLTSVDTKIDGIATNVNDIKTQLSAPANSEATTILGYYHGSNHVQGLVSTNISPIEASNPVLFTVSVEISGFFGPDNFDYVRILADDYITVAVWDYGSPRQGSYAIVGGNIVDSVTFGGMKMSIDASSYQGDYYVDWSITVMGNAGTILTVTT
jgi:Flp pilus assembly pilin Flp